MRQVDCMIYVVNMGTLILLDITFLGQILQAEVKVLRFELTQCKRDKQDLLTKIAQLSIVDKQQSAAIINARDECGKGHMQLSCQKLHEVKAAGKEEPADLARKDSGVCSPPQREVVTPTCRLSVLPLQPIGSDSSQHGTGCFQNNAGSIIPCRAICMIGPDAGDASPDPEGRKVAGGSFELTTNACLEEPLAKQGSCEHPLIPLDVRDIIRSASFTQHTSTEDEPHLEPNTVMRSQVLKCMPPLMRHNVVFDGTALAEEFSSGNSGPGRVKPVENLASHPIKASASNEPSEIMLEQGAGGIQSSHDGTCVGPTWTNGAELRQDSSCDADEPVAVGPGDGLRPPTSLERQVSSVSLAESDTCLCAASDIKGKGVSEMIPKESSADMSRTSVCSHDENLHQPDGAVPADTLPPLSARCQNRTPFNQKVGDRKASAKRPLQTTSIDRERLRQPHARLVDTPVKSAQGHHTSGTRQEWRLAGSSIRVRPDSGRPKSAFVMSASSTLGLPATPRRTKVISPHKARTPDMSRLLGTPQQQRQARRKPHKLIVRSSLDDLSSVRPCSQGVTARRATIAPGTTMPSYAKSDLKAGSCCTHHEKQRWL
eukprot:jgi/Ulvmu1/4708/UM002_0439.1